ncbi:MAG: Alternative oxidase, mitochondrial precursor [Sarcosagium campestre]|nr:MAG: Alternative oxidase, mitochondrial precursor [Sarcosagium campestre]
MYSTTTRVASKAFASKPFTSALAVSFYEIPSGIRRPTHLQTLRASCLIVSQRGVQSKRQFSSTPRSSLEEYFPPPTDSPHIKRTEPAWHHPVYTEKDMKAIPVAHREPQTKADYVANAIMRTLRWGTDLCTGYKHDEAIAQGTEKDTKTPAVSKPYGMSERKWMVRFIFLESIAGVPGMVAASLRHLQSLRRMKRDNGWIETLLEEAYNERMHLLTFMKMAEPGWFMRFMVLGAQGVVYNAFFISYLLSPRTCHRFVGYLEEEAVLTYTRAIADIDAGKLPKWEKLQAPEIAITYWNMPEGHRLMKDLLLYIRADEAKHREVNHTLGNLKQKEDPNPFVSTYKDPSQPHPSKGIEHIKPVGWDRQEVM